MSHLRPFPRLLLPLALAGLAALRAAPVPHPDRPDRLVETREGLSVEYSPGQEEWMELAFVRMRMDLPQPAALRPVPSKNGTAVPGSARDLRERRTALLGAVAAQTGLPAATELQGRAFDTFLGYYDMIAEMMNLVAQELPPTLAARHLAIWQRDDLVRRLRAGAAIEGMSYDPARDSGRFDFNRNFDTPAIKERLDTIQAAIDRQRLKHTFNYNKDSVSATFTLRAPPDQPKAGPPGTVPVLAANGPDLVIPIIYRGPMAAPASAAEFALVGKYLEAAATAIADQAATYRNAVLVNIILHETAEVGLTEKIIASPDRRWLCDGTANYVAWRVARDLIAADFATHVYNLEDQLRLHSPSQPRVDLARWSAVEHEKDGERETDLGRAHYAFATRAMFLLAEQHGEDALARLWADVARTPQKKVSAKTFAEAYRTRFKASLGDLIAAAEKNPIPAAPAPAKPKA